MTTGPAGGGIVRRAKLLGALLLLLSLCFPMSSCTRPPDETEVATAKAAGQEAPQQVTDYY